MGIYDLPAMLDYVLNNTNQKSLHYIGHSMGTTMLFTLLSVRPEYNAKIKLGLCLAPVAFWIELTPTLGLVANNAPLLKVKYKLNYLVCFCSNYCFKRNYFIVKKLIKL